MTEKLKISELYEWTVEETAKVFASREYCGFGDYSSKYVDEWFGDEELAAMTLRLATLYIDELYSEE